MDRRFSSRKRSFARRLPVLLAASVGAAWGLYAALTTRPTLLGLPIRADSFLSHPSAASSLPEQVAVSFARGIVAVLHFGLWPLGSAALAATAVMFVQGFCPGPRH